MNKEKKLVIPHYYICVEEPYKKDNGCVCIAKSVDKDNVSIIEKTYRNDMVKFFIELIDYVADLETKLAESEKENTKLKEVVDCVDKLKQFNVDMKDYALVNRDVADEIYCEHQDKISFAVEQLKQVRKLVDELLDNCGDKQYKVWEVFDNQIKQLKEGK